MDAVAKIKYIQKSLTEKLKREGWPLEMSKPTDNIVMFRVYLKMPGGYEREAEYCIAPEDLEKDERPCEEITQKAFNFLIKKLYE